MDYKVEWCEFDSPFDWAEAVKSVDRVTSCLTRNFNGYWWLFFVDHKGVSSYVYIAPVKGARITKEEKSMCINFLKALGVQLSEKI